MKDTIIMRSLEQIRERIQTVKYDRLLPKEGICVYPNVWYYDVNDIPEETRVYIVYGFEIDSVYKKLREENKVIYKGSIIGRRYCVYVYRNDNLVGIIILKEILDNPHGFREGDFFSAKWICPKYRNTKYSRYAMSDVIHMMFMSGLANSLYSYVKAIEGTQGSFYDRVDRSSPCLGIIYSTDGPDIQKYKKVVRELHTEHGDYILTENVGNVYRKMNLKKYFMIPPGRKEEVVDKWLKEMDEAARKVKEVINGSYAD